MNNETRKKVEAELVSIIKADLEHQRKYRPRKDEKFRSEGYIRSIMHIEEYFQSLLQNEQEKDLEPEERKPFIDNVNIK